MRNPGVDRSCSTERRQSTVNCAERKETITTEMFNDSAARGELDVDLTSSSPNGRRGRLPNSKL